MKINAIIFDMDGVLVNTPKYALASNNEALKKYGVSLTPKEQKEFQGTSLMDRVPLYEKKFNIEIDFETYSSTFIETQLALASDEIQKSAPAIKSLFVSLKNLGLKTAVVSAARKEKVFSILNQLDITDLLNSVMSADDIKMHKPNPAPYIEMLKRLTVSPEAAIIIEDSPNGITAAKAANVRTYALQTSEFTNEDLSEADEIIEDITDVLNILN